MGKKKKKEKQAKKKNAKKAKKRHAPVKKSKGHKKKKVIIKRGINFSTLKTMMDEATAHGFPLPGTVDAMEGEHVITTSDDLTSYFKHGDCLGIKTRQDRHGISKYYISKIFRAEFGPSLMPMDRNWRFDDQEGMKIVRFPCMNAERELVVRTYRMVVGTKTYQIYLRFKIKIMSSAMRICFAVANVMDEDMLLGRAFRGSGNALERWKDNAKDLTLRVMRERDEHFRFALLFALHRGFKKSKRLAIKGYKFAKRKYKATEFAKRRARGATGGNDDSDDD